MADGDEDPPELLLLPVLPAFKDDATSGSNDKDLLKWTRQLIYAALDDVGEADDEVGANKSSADGHSSSAPAGKRKATRRGPNFPNRSPSHATTIDEGEF